MPRYAAFLRGVSPMNAKMTQLKGAFEAAGFTDVKTVLSSGNVVFSASRASESPLQRKAEAAMMERLGDVFLTIVRPIEALREMLASDPNPKGPIFMTLIEKTFGKELTTRSWDTVARSRADMDWLLQRRLRLRPASRANYLRQPRDHRLLPRG